MTAHMANVSTATSARRRDVAETYYDSAEADAFYMKIWGGEDIHIGLYSDGNDTIFDASRRTVETMAAMLAPLAADTKVLDLGAGYGGSARLLAKTFGCAVTCLNISEAQNAYNRQLNREQRVTPEIEVLHASFEDVPLPDRSVDVVWSQDAFLHSGDRGQVLREVDRLLRPGGRLIFTDPMQADDCPAGVLQPVYDRIHLDSLGSMAFYREQASRHGWREVGIKVMTEQLRTHYDRVGRELRARYDEMCAISSPAYCDRMQVGLQHWVSAADRGWLAWGILLFEKPSG